MKLAEIAEQDSERKKHEADRSNKDSLLATAEPWLLKFLPPHP